MIPVNELRIGNWVNLVKVVPVRVTADHIKSISEGDQDYVPIPLTPEILEKAGFEYEGATTLTRDNFCVYFKKWNNEIKTFAFYLNNQVEVPCSFVHQLQNLYFALTGEELMIRLDTDKRSVATEE